METERKVELTLLDDGAGQCRERNESGTVTSTWVRPTLVQAYLGTVQAYLGTGLPLRLPVMLAWKSQ